MPAPRDVAPETPETPPAGNAVERSLEDFIARANTTLPPVTTEAAREVRALGSRRRNRSGPARSPLVVLGPRGPLAEETEIVTRISPEDLVPARKPWFSLKLGLAFVAGAAVVLVATQLISGGGPRPMRPAAPAATATTAAPVAAPSPSPPPPIIVQPMPVVEPAPAPPAAEPEPAVTAAETAEPEPVAEKPRARRPRAQAAPRAPRPAAAAKKPTGLVDPFAN
jgi:hypothetical protein